MLGKRLLIGLLVAASLVPAAAAEDRSSPGRRWSRVDRCTRKPAGRPTLLTAYFSSKSANGEYWPYWGALRAMKRADVPTYVMRRIGSRRWNDFSYAGGRAGRMVPGAWRLRRQRPPEDRLAHPMVQLDCAGLDTNEPEFYIWIPRNVHPREVVARHGGREKILGPFLFDGSGGRIWELRRREGSGVVQRAIEYLTDPQVYAVEIVDNTPAEPHGSTGEVRP